MCGKFLLGHKPWDTRGVAGEGDGRGAGVLPAPAGGEGEALLRRAIQEDEAFHQLQRPQGHGAQLAGLPAPSLPPIGRVRARLAVQS